MNDEGQNPAQKPCRRFIAIALLSSFIIHPSSFALADSIFVGTLETKGVTIREVKGDTLVYEINGRISQRDIERITRLVVTSEAQLNAAEEAFDTEKWDQAVDGYQKALKTTSKVWVKDWASIRLIQAAGKSGRFDAAALAYTQMLLKDPESAAKMKPAMPESKSTYLDTAISDVNGLLKDPKLTTAQKRALLGFLIELQQAHRDRAGEDAAYEQLSKLPGADENDPNARRVLANRRLDAASKAIQAKDYAKALNEIDAARAMFIDPENQVDALYIVAEARYGLAGTEPAALKDAALAYMRTVAAARNLPAQPHAADALLKTAAILEKTGNIREATQLYRQIVAQYPDQPAAIAARTKLQDVKQD